MDYAVQYTLYAFVQRQHNFKFKLRNLFYAHQSHAFLAQITSHNIMLQNEEVCGNTIYSSSEASGVNHIIHRSRRLR